MTLPVPKLDTIAFEALVEEARGLIPRYAPRWTDHNLHDPGMTLIDLLAFVVDRQVYRVGFVGDSHLRAFAKLLGQPRLKGPLPARGLIWPFDQVVPLTATLSAGAAVKSERQPDVPFELARDVFISDARQLDVSLRHGARSLSLASLAGRDDAWFEIPVSAADDDAVLSLRFDRPLVPAVEPAARPVSLGIDVVPMPGVEGAEHPHRWGPLAFDYSVDGNGRLRLDPLEDDTFALARTGTVSLAIPPMAGGGSELRLRLDLGFFPIAPRLVSMRINVLPVVQYKRVPAAMIERSTGLPDQVLPLDTSALPDRDTGEDPPSIHVFDGRGDVEWEEVVDLSESAPTEQLYVREPKQIRFGNGVNGRNPPPGAQINHGPFARTLGAAGNLRAGLTFSVAGAPQTASGFGKSIAAFSGGADAWDMTDLVAAARDSAMTRQVLLSNEDLRRAALLRPGFAVARAEVLPNFSPHLPDRSVAGVRSLVAIPYRSVSVPAGAVPDIYLAALKDALAPDKVLGEQLFVIGPRYVETDLRITVLARPGADLAGLRDAVKEKVGARLADLPRDDAIEPWPFGRLLTSGEIKALVAEIDGVAAVSGCAFSVGGAPFSDDDVTLERDQIAIARNIDPDVQQTPERPR